MTKLERVQAALKRQPTDRPPYAFWRHFPDVDRNPAARAIARSVWIGFQMRAHSV